MSGKLTARVWDLPVRLFHWALVLLIAFSWWSGENHDMERHRLSGYAILALLLFRVFWGFAGSRTARFAQFVRSPRVVRAYVGGQFQGGDGHNPLGGWSVVAMLALLLAQVVAGLFAVDVDGFESGPLADWISFDGGRLASEIHEALFKLTLAIIALHIAAIGFYLLVKRQNLVLPMITGKKVSVVSMAVEDSRWSPLLALVGVGIAGAIAWAVSTGL